MEQSQRTADFHESELVRLEGLKSQITAAQIGHLSALDEMQVATADGSRSLSEWVGARLDANVDSARSLVRTMRRTEDRLDLREALAAGEVSFDRVEALSKIQDDVGLLEHLDVGGVYREAARRTRITVEDEVRTAESNHLFMQPTLDETWVRIRGGLDGYSASLVDKTLTDLAEAQPDLPDGTRGDRSWRRATALVELCTSGGGEDAPPANVTVFVDAKEAAASNGEAGVMLEAGPKVGVLALEAILCDSSTELIVTSDDGIPMVYGRRLRTAPPALKRAVIHRAGGVCQADGCNSRYRLEAHHVTPWSQGGSTDPDDLVALCWFHHHVIIHQRGFEMYWHPDHGRIRFQEPARSPPDNPSDRRRFLKSPNQGRESQSTAVHISPSHTSGLISTS